MNEEIIGKAIKKFNIPRHKLTILAKCYGTVPEEPGIFKFPFEKLIQKSKDYVNQGGELICMKRHPGGAYTDDVVPSRIITRRDLQSRQCFARATRNRLYRRSPDP